MKRILLLIFFWYLLLTVFALIASNTLAFNYIFPGLLLTWSFFFFFYLGNKTTLSPKGKSSEFKTFNKAISKPPPFFIISIIVIFSSIAVAKFYTGNSLATVYNMALSGGSLYREYQEYFSDNSLAELTIQKVPYVLLLLLIKLTLIYSVIYLITLNQQIKKLDIIAMILIVISYIYISIARGTTFEIFEIFVLFVYSFFIKSILRNSKTVLSAKFIIYISLSIILVLIIYSYNISIRSETGLDRNCITLNLCLDKQSILYSLSAVLAKVSFNLSAYFSYGFYQASVYINDIWFSTNENFISGLIPYGFLATQDTSIIREICDKQIDCGFTWHPDILHGVNSLGIFMLFALAMTLGSFHKKLLLKIKLKNSMITKVLMFYIVLYLVSLPVGNFIFVSSSNILTLMIFMFLYILSLFKINLFKLK